MIHAQNTKIVNLITPASIATNATATGTVSVAGWDYAQILVHLATQTAGSTDVALALTESDGTSYTTNADYAMTTAAPDTSNAQVYGWLISTKTRKKNLKISYTPGVGARVASAVAILSRGELAPTTAALRGLTAQVIAQ